MSNQKLWHKTCGPHPLVDAFSVGDDIEFDQQLIPFDILGSLAHIKMLHAVGLLLSEDYKKLHYGLQHLYDLYSHHKLVLSPEDEDVHTRIENELSDLYPHSGGKIHLGRSRNDQVLVDLRLFTKEKLLGILINSLNLALDFVVYAKKYEFYPMPGYTHMQPAMLSSVGLWSSQFAESLMDDCQILSTAYKLNDQNPLGSGASYGVSLPLDRDYTTQLLGFSKVQNNSLYCQNSRGKIEAMVAHSLVQIMQTLSRFAQDLLLYTTAEFNLFKLPMELTTGSSIMPQKRNVDIMELLRAKTKAAIAHELQISTTISGLPSGYNRDLQEIKPPLMKSLQLVSDVLDISRLTIANLIPNEKCLRQKIGNDMFAAHHAYRLVRESNISFRDAYREVGMHLENIPTYNPDDVFTQMNHVGSPGKLGLENLSQLLNQEQYAWKQKQSTYISTINKLLE